MTPSESRILRNKIFDATGMTDKPIKTIMKIIKDFIVSREETISGLKSALMYYSDSEMYEGGRKSFISRDKGRVARSELYGELGQTKK